MAVNAISSSRISASLDTVQAANQLETRANRAQQRADQAGQTRRAEQTARSDKGAQATQKRVEQNSSAQRGRAQANDDAAGAQRRDAQAADKQADQQRRAADQATVGSRINTTA